MAQNILRKILIIEEKFKIQSELLREVIELGEQMLQNNTLLSTVEKQEIERLNQVFKRQFQQLKQQTINELEQMRAEQ